MRKKLIKLIQEAVGGCAEHWAGLIAGRLIENGVIMPPVKVGQTVYSYCDGLHRILPYFVESLDIAYLNEKTNCYGYIANCVEENNLLDSIDFECEDIGKTVFLTEAEAEQELAERRVYNA